MDHLPNVVGEMQKRVAVGDLNKPLGDVHQVCEKHGGYVSSGVRYAGIREVWTKCPDCVEESLKAARMAEAQAIAQRKQERIEAMIQQACIPARFVGRSFENFKADTAGKRNALNIAQDYAHDFERHLKAGTGLIFSGLPGTGKSHLATAILQAIMPKHSGLYITCLSLIRAVRATWRKDSEESEETVLRTMAQVPLLVLDEIGVQYGTDGEQTILFDVLDRRYREMMPTILLTNQAKQGFKEFIGERSFDRLVESSRWVPFDWDSYRATARKETA